MLHKNNGINPQLIAHIPENELSFERLVDAHYESMYRFALGLSRREADACDLTQQTFYQWAKKGHQLRDKSRVKAWLFQTLYREHLKIKGRELRFVCWDDDHAERDEPAEISPSVADRIDAETLMKALFTIDELYRAPLILFYLEDHSYKVTAEILDVPVGTVMSRLSRAKDMLRKALSARINSKKIVPLKANRGTEAL